MSSIVVIIIYIVGAISIYEGDMESAQAIYLLGIFFIIRQKGLNNE